MIEREHPELSVSAQCKLLDLCRSSLYYKPVSQESDLNLRLMQELDKQYLKTPRGGGPLLWHSENDPIFTFFGV